MLGGTEDILSTRTPRNEAGNRGDLIRPDFRALFAGAGHGFFHSSDLTSENEPAFSGSEKTPLMARLTLRLRNFLVGVCSALATGKHGSGLIVRPSIAPGLAPCLCNIDHMDEAANRGAPNARAP